jgi:hypothetical protein
MEEESGVNSTNSETADIVSERHTFETVMLRAAKHPRGAFIAVLLMGVSRFQLPGLDSFRFHPNVSAALGTFRFGCAQGQDDTREMNLC